jgi:hypothetical protein
LLLLPLGLLRLLLLLLLLVIRPLVGKDLMHGGCVLWLAAAGRAARTVRMQSPCRGWC